METQYKTFISKAKKLLSFFTFQNISVIFVRKCLQNSNRTPSVIQIEVCHLKLMPDVYKSNMIIMLFHRKRNIDV